MKTPAATVRLLAGPGEAVSLLFWERLSALRDYSGSRGNRFVQLELARNLDLTSRVAGGLSLGLGMQCVEIQ